MAQENLVFTVFFCGTSADSFGFQHPNYPNGELVATLANYCGRESMEFVDWIVIDGPGSGNLQEDILWVEPGKHWDITGKLTGAGWEENVAHAMAMIKGNYEWKRTKLTKEEYEQLKKAGIPLDDPKKSGYWFWRNFEYPNRKVTPQELQAQKAKIFRKGKLPTVVNLIGWSRGGVSCHMLANAMFEDDQLKNIPVNIFAVDPVPGLKNFQKHRTSIPANVNNYVAVYARDERSRGFTPTVPNFSKQNKAIIIPVPGRHATLVGNGAIDGENGEQVLSAPGKLVRHLAEKYLTDWGTKFELDKKLNLSPGEMAQLYEDMVEDTKKYEDLRSKSYVSANVIWEFNVTQEIDGERAVSKGADWTNTKFTDIRGDEYLYPDGLAPVGKYLSWHHKQVSEGV